jgi:hypothetical protein
MSLVSLNPGYSSINLFDKSEFIAADHSIPNSFEEVTGCCGLPTR